MTANILLSRLDQVKRTGRNRWIARCPAHNDHSPSLAVREMDDGHVLIHCFAGCAAHEVVAALEMEMSDLFPPRAIDHRAPQVRRPVHPGDALRCLVMEAMVVYICATDMAAGQPLSDADRQRLLVAASRIQEAACLC
jgi:hypothetical protein